MHQKSRGSLVKIVRIFLTRHKRNQIGYKEIISGYSHFNALNHLINTVSKENVLRISLIKTYIHFPFIYLFVMYQFGNFFIWQSVSSFTSLRHMIL